MFLKELMRFHTCKKCVKWPAATADFIRITQPWSILQNVACYVPGALRGSGGGAGAGLSVGLAGGLTAPAAWAASSR